MAVRRPLLPSRQLLILLVAITLGLASALVWLGLQLVRQDRDLEAQRVREHLERAAETVADLIQRRLADLGDALDQAGSLPAGERSARLARWGDSLPSGAILVELNPDTIRAYPDGRLLFDPSLPPGPGASDPAFEAGERLEYRTGDLAGAANAYEALSQSTASGRRAGALLRLGRTLRKAGRLEEALRVYGRLALHESVLMEGLPADLAGRHEKINLLRRLNRGAEAESEIRTLYADLVRGRWRLSRGGFEYYSADLHQQLGSSADSAGFGPSPGALRLSRAVDSLWQEGLRAVPAGGSGRRLVSLDGGAVLLVWSARSGTRLAFLAAPEYLSASWLPDLESLLLREGVWLALGDPGGAVVFSQLPDGVLPGMVRAAVDSRLPWTLGLASRDPTGLVADLAARRRILLAGLAVASLLGLLGTYAVARAVSRELEVARVQSDFVAAVSHEFRTPLTSIRQLSELLASDRVPGEERRHAYYEVMRRESARLHRLVEGLLDFGRMEAGAHEFRFEAIDAANLVRDVVGEFGQESAGSDRRVEVREPGEPCPVRGDREALARALWNLLDNAAKYSAEDRPVTVGVTRGNGRVAISVRDRGPGVPPEEQSRIFEKFVRGRDAGASGVRGTGLGLAMVRQIARAHRGEIRLRTAAGEGSTFTLLLPVDEAQ